MNNVYSKEELDFISKLKDSNDKMEDFLNIKRSEWNNNINPLFDILKENFTQESYKKIIEAQSYALSYRQMINEEISFFLNKRSKEEVKLKRAKQEKFIFYATGFGLKTSLGEKTILIDGSVSELERTTQLIDVHVDFLRNSSKSLDNLGYSIKNIIELMGYLK